MPTPTEPYGGHLGGDPSPFTRKVYKKREDNLKRLAKDFKERNKDELEKQRRREVIHNLEKERVGGH